MNRNCSFCVTCSTCIFSGLDTNLYCSELQYISIHVCLHLFYSYIVLFTMFPHFFLDDIEYRKRLRQKKMRLEKRWSKKIQDEERRRLGISPGMKIVKSALCPQVVSENRPSSPAATSDSSEQSLPSISSPIGSPLGNYL